MFCPLERFQSIDDYMKTAPPEQKRLSLLEMNIIKINGFEAKIFYFWS